MAENILQHEALTDFVYPFLLVFFIIFAILEKTKVLGENRQVNAFVAFVIGLIFVAAVNPKLIVTNLILFLAVAVVIVLVVMLVWGFLVGEEAKFSGPKGLKWVVAVIVIIAVVIYLFMSEGISDEVYEWLFKSDWSNDVWTNIIFVVIIAVALAVVLAGAKSKGGG